MDVELLQPYSDLHQNPEGPADARPTALRIVQDEKLVMQWQDKTVLITGGSSGIGIETARALHHTGAAVFITTRNIEKARAVCGEILASSPSKNPIGIIEMELDSLASVKTGAVAFLAQSNRLNILINNAGVMACPKGKTSDGFETHMGTNHFAHFLLTQILMPTLIASASAKHPSRVVNLASMGHWHQEGGIGAPGVLEDLHYDTTTYEPMVAYGRSKHANILHALEIEQRYGTNAEHPVHAFSLHPGGITTELWRHLDSEDAVSSKTSKAHWNTWKNVEQGAATTIWCATAEAWHGKGGKYCEDCGESGPSPCNSRSEWVPGTPGHAPWAYDQKAAQKLWQISENAVQRFV